MSQFKWASGEPLNWLRDHLLDGDRRREYTEIAEMASRRFHQSFSAESVRHAVRRYVFNGEDRLPKNLPAPSAVEHQILGVLLKGPVPLSSLSEKVDRSVGTVKRLLQSLRESGYQIPHIEDDASPVVLFKEVPIVKEPFKGWFEGREFRFAVVSDTHGGSSLAKWDELHVAYDWIKKEGISTVYHSGDIFDGVKMYRGHEYEVAQVGGDKQHYAVAGSYPSREGVTTYLIGGNHDYSFTRSSGLDLCARIPSGFSSFRPETGETIIIPPRPDIVYLGPVERDVLLNDTVHVRLYHPSGGGAYALSYHPQKTIESYVGGTKPQILLIGHYHISFWFDYRNILTCTGGCFQGQSLWMKEKHLQPAIGFWIWTVVVRDDGTIMRATPEWLKFYEGKLDVARPS